LDDCAIRVSLMPDLLAGRCPEALNRTPSLVNRTVGTGCALRSINLAPSSSANFSDETLLLHQWLWISRK
jgi:hypothetical protein